MRAMCVKKVSKSKSNISYARLPKDVLTKLHTHTDSIESRCDVTTTCSVATNFKNICDVIANVT